MILSLELPEVKKFFADKLEQEKKNPCTDPHNAGSSLDAGRIAALEDIIHLLEIYGEFAPLHAHPVAVAKISQRRPAYNPATDKSNGDAWWIFGYVSRMKMLGVTGLDTTAIHQTNKENAVRLDDVHEALIQAAAALKTYQLNLSLQESPSPQS